MSNGRTINICNINCTKFLGKTIGISPTATHKLASDNIKQQAQLYLQHIDNCSVRGEYKVWILTNCPSLSYCCGEAYSDINLIHPIICLSNLPNNYTTGTAFHPDVLDLPFLPHLKESAKLSYILANGCSTTNHILTGCSIALDQEIHLAS